MSPISEVLSASITRESQAICSRFTPQKCQRVHFYDRSGTRVMLRRVLNIYSLYFPNSSLSLSRISKTIVRNITRDISQRVSLDKFNWRWHRITIGRSSMWYFNLSTFVPFLRFYILQTFPWSPVIYKRNQTSKILAHVLCIKSHWFVNSFFTQTLLVKRKLHFLIPKVTTFKSLSILLVWKKNLPHSF